MHRVQRVPVTESQGRVHTSAAGVLVLPEAEQVDVTIDENDLRIDVFRSSGPGGQSVNTTDSAVRITHVPTGIVVSCQNEKSQLQNREQAMRILRARLLAAAQEEADAEASEARRSQVRTVDRSERIRTYNFPENRISDHRTGYKAYNLDQVLDGDLEPVLDSCVDADLAARLAALEAVSARGTGGRCGAGRAADGCAAAGVASPERDADELLAHVLGTDARPAARWSTTCRADAAAAYDALVARRAAREPLQHLTGAAAFRHVELAVGPGVFVPRPETELLAGWAIERATRRWTGPVVVDLGTGSGAIAAAVADEVPARPGARRRARPSGARLGRAQPRRHRRRPAARRHGRRPSTTWPAPSTWSPATRRTSRSTPGSRWRPRPATTTRDLALFSGRRRARRDPGAERAGGACCCGPAAWSGAEHADVQGESAPAVFAGHRAVDRGPRPPRPGRPSALRDGAAGTMTT